MAKKLKWVFRVELAVDPIWVADGFRPTARQVEELFTDHWLDFAYEHEFKARAVVISKPTAKEIRMAGEEA
jgi:hypothetical protein